MHPHLLWDTLITAVAAVMGESGAVPPFAIPLSIENVPGFGEGEVRLLLDPTNVPSAEVVRIRHTYEPSRLIELAAIAIAGIALHYAGGHEILDVAVRGSAADYLIDATRHRLEVAGRSRRSDFRTAWQKKWDRLQGKPHSGCYVCVVEFESPATRLAFAD